LSSTAGTSTSTGRHAGESGTGSGRDQMKARRFSRPPRRWSPATRPAGDGRETPTCNSGLPLWDSPDGGGPARLSRADRDHAHLGSASAARSSTTRRSPGDRRRDSLDQSPDRSRDHSRIKVDTGAKDLAGHPGEKVTEGLDVCAIAWLSTLRWARALRNGAPYRPGDGIPSRVASRPMRRHWLDMRPCARGWARPGRQPEVLMDGDHALARCAETTEYVLRTVFDQLYLQR